MKTRENWEQELRKVTEQIDKTKRQSTGFAWLRFAFFVVMLVLILGFFRSTMWGLSLVGALCFGVCFFVCVKQSEKCEQKLLDLYAKNQVLSRYVSRLDDTWKTIRQKEKQKTTKFQKSQFDNQAQETDGYELAKDLDLLGEYSLYTYLSGAHSVMGERKLTEALLHPELQRTVIEEKQECVRELIQKQEFCIEYETICSGLEKENRSMKERAFDLKSDAEPIGERTGKDLGVGTWVLIGALACAGTISMLVLTVYGIGSGTLLLGWMVGLLILSWIVKPVTAKAILPIYKEHNTIRAYGRAVAAIYNETFQSRRLRALHEQLTAPQDAMKGLRSLRYVLGIANQRQNLLAGTVLNAVCFYDVWVVVATMIWNKNYGEQLPVWIDTVADMEVYVSLATIGQVRTTVFPVIRAEETPYFKGEDMRHPLLSDGGTVGNGITLDRETVVITGSNMSGKTTFLRTIGLMAVLAYAGAPVPAKSLELSVMSICTSIRVEDDVNQGISSFYAEILRIRAIVSVARDGKPMLALIDELFKGTNSADRIVGATSVVKQLKDTNSIVVVTTHDFELCSLAQNYHFQEYYENDKLCFDYQLHLGKCETTNAIALLRMSGLME